jgi:APA family basic amino acid/polyamine antiporter
MNDQRLQRRLTLTDAIAIVVGSMIGSGIFLKASGIAQLIPHPPLILLVWLAAGLLTLGGALVLAELGAMMPEAGGLYVYLRRAYGPFVGFLFGWSLLAVLQTGSIAGLAAGAMQSLQELVPGIAQHQFLFSAALIILLTGLNVISVKSGAKVQNVLTLAKVLGIAILVGGAFLMGGASASNFTPNPDALDLTTIGLLGAIGLCMTKALWAYDGWVNLGFMAGELKEPQKNLPKAIGMGIGFVIAVYTITNAAYHFVLPLDIVQNSDSVAVVVATKLFKEPGLLAMSILTFVSMAGALNSSILSAPRVYYAMAQDGKFPQFFGSVHPSFKTPHIALIVQGFWSIGLLTLWGTFEKLTDNVVFVFWIFYALGAGAVIRLRAKEPHTHRPYKVIGYPWVPFVFIVAAVLLTANTLYQAPGQSAQALGLVLTGAVLYAIFGSLIKEPDVSANRDTPPYYDDDDD